MATIYKGASIEQERDGSFTIYFDGNPFATRSGFKSREDAKTFLDRV